MSGHASSRRRAHSPRVHAAKQWQEERRRRCQRCAGAGKYQAAYPPRLVDPCPVCNGTGTVVR